MSGLQTLQVDASGHLWALDTGTLHFGQPPVKGAPKLVEIDLASNRVLRKIVFPPEALASKTALKDFRLNLRLGQQGTVFITDSGPGCEALIVLDLASGPCGHAPPNPFDGDRKSRDQTAAEVIVA